MRWTQKLAKFYFLPARKKLALLEAAALLTLSGLLVWGVSFPRYSRFLAGRPDARHSGADARLAQIVQWSIATASHNLPWNSTCLTQAMAARWMLSRQGQRTELHLGTRKNDSGNLDFHAWLICGDEVICGHHEHEQYTVLHSFES